MEWSKISQLPYEEIKERQNKLLENFMQHELPYSPFYRKLFEDHGIKFSDIRTTDDLQKVPFTTKADIAPTKEDSAKSRGFILAPDEKLIKKYASKAKLGRIIWGKITQQDVKKELEWEYKPIHMHFTTGRSAMPMPFVYSARDIEVIREAGERLLNTAKVSRDLVAINAFP